MTGKLQPTSAGRIIRRLFPDEGLPLDPMEAVAWEEMHSEGLGMHVVQRTTWLLSYTVAPIALPVWGAWAGNPTARGTIAGSIFWVSTSVATILIGSAGAAYNWQRWLSFERRSLIEGEYTPVQIVERASALSRRVSLRGAAISTAFTAFILASRAPWWLGGISGFVALLAWRSAISSRRSFKKVFKALELTR